jgi:hypothetical protein
MAQGKIASVGAQRSVGGVMKGWVGSCVFFHNQQRVPVLPTPCNPSWHLTPGKRCSSAARFTSLGPAWLSSDR